MLTHCCSLFDSVKLEYIDSPKVNNNKGFQRGFSIYLSSTKKALINLLIIKALKSLSSGPTWARTKDPLIMSQVL